MADQKSHVNHTDADSNTLLNTKKCEEIFKGLNTMWPQAQDAKEKDIISSSDQSKFQQFKSEFSYDEDNVDPSVISAIVQTDQGQSNFIFGIKGFKSLAVAGAAAEANKAVSAKEAVPDQQVVATFIRYRTRHALFASLVITISV